MAYHIHHQSSYQLLASPSSISNPKCSTCQGWYGFLCVGLASHLLLKVCLLGNVPNVEAISNSNVFLLSFFLLTNVPFRSRSSATLALSFGVSTKLHRSPSLLIDSLLQYQFKLQVDAKHYFYQIPTSSKLSKFFGFRCGSKRGMFWQRAFNVLPVGTYFSPTVGQSISTTICMHVTDRVRSRTKEDFMLVPWLDNFIGGAHTRETLECIQS